MVSDRSLFWAELGLVASPSLLARAARVLEEHADSKDAELGEALRLAAEHVRRDCVVWPHQTATLARPPQRGTTFQMPPMSTPLMSSYAETSPVVAGQALYRTKTPPQPHLSSFHSSGLKGSPCARRTTLTTVAPSDAGEMSPMTDTMSGDVHYDKCSYRASGARTPAVGDGCAFDDDGFESHVFMGFNSIGTWASARREEEAAKRHPGTSAQKADVDVLDVMISSEEDEDTTHLPPPKKDTTLGLRNFVEPSVWLTCLPVIGSDYAHILWCIAQLSIAATVFGYAATSAIEDGRLLQYMIDSVVPLHTLAVALGAFTSVPWLIALRRVATSSAWIEGSTAILMSPSGPEFRRFFKKAIAIVICLQLLIIPEVIARSHNLMWIEIVFQVLSELVRAIGLVELLMLWKISMISIDPLRSLLRDLSCDLSRRRDWLAFMRAYQDDVKLLEALWRDTFLAVAISINLITWMAYLMWAMALIMAGGMPIWHTYSTIRQIVVATVMLMGLAKIASKRTSMRPATQSLCVLAMACPVSRPEETSKRLAFIQTISHLRCGVELPGVGVLTNSTVVPLVRVILISVPFCFGLAVKLVRSKQYGPFFHEE